MGREIMLKTEERLTQRASKPKRMAAEGRQDVERAAGRDGRRRDAEGRRRDPVGLRRDTVGLRRDSIGLRQDAIGLRQDAISLYDGE